MSYWDPDDIQAHPDFLALDASMDFVTLMATPEQETGRDGLFGPVVDVPAGSSRLDRVIGLSGRNPSWKDN
jgi:hypothetical protein